MPQPKFWSCKRYRDGEPSHVVHSKRIRAIHASEVVQKDENATGDAATNMRENTVTLIGSVVVTRGSNVLRGQRLVVDLTSGISKMDGGRIDGIFQSPRRNPPDPRNEKSSTER
jgi:lipopolysaccharide export system protein LptA